MSTCKCASITNEFQMQDAVELHTLFLNQLEKMLQAEGENAIGDNYVGDLVHQNQSASFHSCILLLYN